MSFLVYGLQKKSYSHRFLVGCTECPIDFASMNYTSITSVCNGTDPNTTLCCTSFVDFACPYADYLNNDATNCATNLFSYLNMAGNYPAALFSSLCQGNAEGLPCPVAPAPAPALPSGGFTHTPWTYSIILMIFSLLAIIL